MKNNTAKEPITVLGIDLAKQSFQLHGVDKDGQVVLKKKLNRKQLSAFVANLPVCLIGLEACGGSHYPRKISCSRFLAQALDSTALPKNAYLTYG